MIIRVSKEDIRMDTFRSGGKGGQNQNKRDSGVRLTHTPTGIATESREERSQYQNKQRCFEKLKLLLEDYYRKEKGIKGPERNDSSEIVRTYHFVDDYVLDHSTGIKKTIKDVVNKDGLDEIIIERVKLGKVESKRQGGRM